MWVYNQLTLQLAKAFSGNTLFFSHYLDWRGRIYTQSFYLNYQGSDIARSLLLFKNVGFQNHFEYNLNKILDSSITKELLSLKNKDLDYVKLYLANVYGLNKLTRVNRIKWFNNNIKDIIDLLNNNFDLFKSNYL